MTVLTSFDLDGVPYKYMRRCIELKYRSRSVRGIDILANAKMASTSLSDEDFQRLQVQLLELKSSNYVLEERCSKQLNEIETLKKKLNSADTEYLKAIKIINKSKKIKDVELIIQDHESLQLKMQRQEEEFQLQNTTLMQELSMLISDNEKLEKEVKVLRGGQNYSDDTKTEHNKLKDDVRRLQAENTALLKKLENNQQRRKTDTAQWKNALHRDEPVHETCDENQQLPEMNSVEVSCKDDFDVVEVGEKEVSFKRVRSDSMCEVLQEAESRVEALEAQLETLSDIKLKLDMEVEEKRILHAQLLETESLYEKNVAALQLEVNNLGDKLKKKCESYLQLQTEKEELFSEKSAVIAALEESKNEEIKKLQELIQRLQSQLNNTLENLEVEKCINISTIEDLEKKCKYLQLEVDDQAAEKIQELEATRIVLESKLSSMKTERDALQKENSRLNDQIIVLGPKIPILEDEVSNLQRELEDLRKVAEKRKSLLDEMAIHVQMKVDGHQSEMSRLTEQFSSQLETLTRDLEEEKRKNTELDKLKILVEDQKTELKSLECTRGWFERRLNEAEETMERTKMHHEAVVCQMREEKLKAEKELMEEHMAACKDLVTQVEIANAQKSEYEDMVSSLRQEIKDGIEDRRIHEKKGISIVKDLKRQLQTERRRGDKLQEKLQEFLTDSCPGRTSEIFKAAEAGEKAETSSISSWSMMSGGQSEAKEPSETNGVVAVAEGSPSPQSGLEMENYNLLARLTEVQQEKWIAEEKLNHLEQSNAAMADDIINKSAIIQYYCMEGRPAPHSHHASPDRLTVKRVMDFIKDKGDENLKEMNRRMQRMLEETLTKNMFLQKDLEAMSQDLMKFSKMPVGDADTSR